MLNFDQFIPSELMQAYPHPLSQNLTRHLPDGETGSIQEIREMQLRDRIPGLVKRLIPLNPLTFWEYWWCVPGRMLLPEDMEVLKRDRPRLEAILSKLVWLLGGNCFGDDTSLQEESTPVYDWPQVLAFVESSGLRPDLLDIDFLPTAIEPLPYFSLGNGHDPSSQESPNFVAIEPAHWHIEFFQLEPIAGGFDLVHPKQLCSCQIWTGKPFIKNLKTGETKTRYDLWISCPHDLVNSIDYED